MTPGGEMPQEMRYLAGGMVFTPRQAENAAPAGAGFRMSG